MQTGKVCKLVPLSPSSSKWSRERERETAQGWSTEVDGWVGVSEHLTQTPFVLWAGVSITAKVCVCVLGGPGAN